MEFNTPVGRLVQGSVTMQQLRDMDTNQPKVDKQGNPEMGIFLALAFPKVLPNGQANTEFVQFYSTMQQVAAASWPQFFPQGPTGMCTHPRFSWKYQDGDGVNNSGQSVADKAGFAGHHILKFSTSFPVRCFHEGKFADHEVIQNPDEIIKRGYWLRLFGEMKSNNATGTQVPGIVLYPKLVSLVERGEEIVSGPDATTAFGSVQPGWRPPPSASPIPLPGGAAPALGMPPPPVAAPAIGMPPPPVAAPALGMPPPPVAAPAIGMPPPPVAAPAIGMPPPPVAAPAIAVNPGLAAQGITWASLQAQGWTEADARAQGYIV